MYLLRTLFIGTISFSLLFSGCQTKQREQPAQEQQRQGSDTTATARDSLRSMLDSARLELDSIGSMARRKIDSISGTVLDSASREMMQRRVEGTIDSARQRLERLGNQTQEGSAKTTEQIHNEIEKTRQEVQRSFNR